MDTLGTYLSNSFGKQPQSQVDCGNYRGWLVSPGTYGVPSGIQNGDKWGGDNGCYVSNISKKPPFSPDNFGEFLNRFRRYHQTCMFVVAPDVYANAWATTDRFYIWAETVKNFDYPLAYVTQDFVEHTMIPWKHISCLFIGGTDMHKDGGEGYRMVRMAIERGVHVHVGRINTRPRLSAYMNLVKSITGNFDGFTFDGNGMRFDSNKRQMSVSISQAKMDFLI